MQYTFFITLLCFLCTNMHAADRILYGISANPYTSTKEGIIPLADKYRPDLIETKTFFPMERPGNNPTQSIVYIDNTGQFAFQEDLEKTHLKTTPYMQYGQNIYNIANSVGLSSPDMGSTRRIIWHTARELEDKYPNTKLIFSVSGRSVKDFCTMAGCAVELKVPYVSVNLSCPNIHDGTLLYKNHDMVRKITAAMVPILDHIPLIAKIGFFSPQELPAMELILNTLAQNKVYAVYGINAPQMRVVHPDGTPAFGPGRERCGVSGTQIRTLALCLAGQARSMIDKNNLSLKLFVGGGITSLEDFVLFERHRPDALFSATGVLCNPTFQFPHTQKSNL